MQLSLNVCLLAVCLQTSLALHIGSDQSALQTGRDTIGSPTPVPVASLVGRTSRKCFEGTPDEIDHLQWVFEVAVEGNLWSNADAKKLVPCAQRGFALSQGPSACYLPITEHDNITDPGQRKIYEAEMMGEFARFDEEHQLNASFSSFKESGCFCLGLGTNPKRCGKIEREWQGHSKLAHYVPRLHEWNLYREHTPRVSIPGPMNTAFNATPIPATNVRLAWAMPDDAVIKRLGAQIATVIFYRWPNTRDLVRESLPEVTAELKMNDPTLQTVHDAISATLPEPMATSLWDSITKALKTLDSSASPTEKDTAMLILKKELFSADLPAHMAQKVWDGIATVVPDVPTTTPLPNLARSTGPTTLSLIAALIVATRV